MESVRRLARAASAPVAGFCAALWSVRGEIAVTAALLGGWACATIFAATWFGARAWLASGALLLLSLVGWKYLGTLAWKGLYTLSHEDADDA